MSAGEQTVAAFFENLESSRYKYRLIERLRRHISLIGVGSYYRLYFYNFFGAVFDASVVITEESYRDFRSLMDEDLGMGEYTTVILGAGITKIASESMTDITCVVLLHPADGYIEIDPDFNLVSGTCSNSYCEVTIYTDCEMALATEGLTNVTFYSLDEWEG